MTWVSKLRKLPFALTALFAVVAAIAACAYAISAWQVFGFAAKVWRLPTELCFAAAVVADLLSLAGLFATYLLRKAKLAVQLYAWFVFLVMTGLSIAAAESYASFRFAPVPPPGGGPNPEVIFDARVASAAIVIALALAVHLLILCRNHLTLPVDKDALAATFPTGTAAGTLPAQAPETAPSIEKAPTPALPAVRKEREKTGKTQVRTGPVIHVDDRKERAVKLVLSGKRPAEVAPQFSVSKRSVENWVKQYREQHPEPEPQVPPQYAIRPFPAEGPRLPGVLAGTNVRPINGAAPDVTVDQ